MKTLLICDECGAVDVPPDPQGNCRACGDGTVWKTERTGTGLATIEELEATVRQLDRSDVDRLVIGVFRRLYAEAMPEGVVTPDEYIYRKKSWDDTTVEAIRDLLVEAGLEPYRHDD